VKITRARTWLAGVLRANSVGIKIDVWQSAELFRTSRARRWRRPRPSTRRSSGYR
jgi:hypothetical protein